MRRFSNGIITLHRITGTIVSLFFAMWFLTGLVLIYHGYPGVEDADLNRHRENLPDSLPALQAMLDRLPGDVMPTQVSLRQFQGQTLFSLGNRDTSFTFCPDPSEPVRPVDWQTVESVARRWVNAEPVRVDTLYKRAQWILYSSYDSKLPIYRLSYDDPARHEIFISQRDAEVQQFTDLRSRRWAYFGAIPHKFYIPAIRGDADKWKVWITVGGIFCIIAALTGLYTGIYRLVQRHRRQKGWGTPYRKRVYRWHHVAGLVFGLFMLAWGISGAMSMQRIPTWLVPMQGDYFFSSSKMWDKRRDLPLAEWKLDYRLLKQAWPELKEVEWMHFGAVPAYRIVEGENERYVDARGPVPVELTIPETEVAAGVRRINGDDAVFRIEEMDHYDDYYLSRWNTLTLPVYKVTVDDADGQVYYVNPKTGHVRYLTRNKMVKKWVFSGIHYLNIRWLIERPVLWTIAIWTLCLGGAFVSLTGVVLGIRFIRRQFRRFGRKGKFLQD